MRSRKLTLHTDNFCTENADAQRWMLIKILSVVIRFLLSKKKVVWNQGISDHLVSISCFYGEIPLRGIWPPRLRWPEKIIGISLFLDFFDRGAINQFACSATGSARWFITTRCRYLWLKQIRLANRIPTILIILIVHIIMAVRRMLIKILSAAINDWEQIKVIVPGGCYLALRSSVTIC